MTPTPARRLLRTTLLLVLLTAAVACSHNDPPASSSQARSSLRPPRSSSSSSSSPYAKPGGKALLAAAPVAPAAPPASATTAVPVTIDSACKSDVTSALQSFLDKAPNDTTIEFPKNACYEVEGTLTLRNRNKVAIEGNGTTIKANTEANEGRRHLSIENSTDITIRDLTIVGSSQHPGTYDKRFAFQHAFQLIGVQRVVLDHVAANHVNGDFVYIGRGDKGTSLDVSVTNSTFDGSGRQGISMTDAKRVLIGTNHITNAGRSLIDIEPNTVADQVRDVRITGNTTGKATNFWLANKGAGNSIGSIEIDANTMTEATGGLVFAFGVAGGNRGPYLIHGNELIANNATSDEGSVGAFAFANCHDVTIVHNRVTFEQPGVMPAVELRSSAQIKIDGNDFTGARQPVLSDNATSGLSVSS